MAPELGSISTTLVNKQDSSDNLVISDKIESVDGIVPANITPTQAKLNDLQNDLSELIHLLHVTDRTSVKEIIHATTSANENR